MKHLILRSIREIKSNITQFISIVLIIAVGSGVFNGLFSTITTLSNFLEGYYEDYKMADAWMYVKGITPDEVRDLQEEYPDLLIQARQHVDVDGVLKGDSVVYRFIERTALNTLKLEEGRLSISDDEILVDQSFAQKNGLSLNDTLSITLNKNSNSFTIVGIYNSPEYAYKSVDFSDASSNKRGFGIIIATDATVQNLITQTDTYLDLESEILTNLNDAETKLKDAQATLDDQTLKLDDQIQSFNVQKAMMPPQMAMTYQSQFDQAQEKLIQAQVDLDEAWAEFESTKQDALDELALVSKRIPELLVKGNASDIDKLSQELEDKDWLAKTLLKADHPAYAMVNNILIPIRIITTVFPILFFVASAIVILISMSKTVQNERMQIAIFKGLGLSSKSIALSYLFYGWWAALLGSIPASLVGSRIIPYALIDIFNTRFGFPIIPHPFYPAYIGLALGLAFFFSTLAIVFALRPILREIPAQGMRPLAPKSTKRSSLEKIPALWKKMSYTTKLILRNLQVSKIKLLMSSFGLIGSVALLLTGISFKASANSMITASVSTYAFDYAIKLEPDASMNDVSLPDYITDVEKTSQASATYKDETVGIAMYQAHTQLYTFTSSSNKTMDLGSDDVWVTTILAHNHNLSIGDTLQLTVDDRTYDVIITNITNQYLGKEVILSLDHAQRLGIDTSSSRYVLKSSNGENDTNREELLAQDSIASVDMRDKFRAQASEILGMLNRIITIIVASSLVLSVTVIYNLASINIFERRRELATLRVLGYTVFEVSHLIYVENYILWGLSVVAGIPVGIFMFTSIAHMVSTPEFFMKDTVVPLTLILTFVVSFFFTWVTNRFLGFKLRRIEFVESLKGVE